MRIAVADDDPVSRFLTRCMLERAGYEVTTLENGCLALQHLVAPGGARLALLDWSMPCLDGAAICRAIRARTDQPYVYIVLLTSKESKTDLVAGLEAGADDYLTKPCNAEELKARLRSGERILALHDRLYREARQDPLTKLPNRAHFLGRLMQCVRRSKEDEDYRFAVLFVDLDHFKAINDSFGHAAGDALLTQVAERLRGSIRREDRLTQMAHPHLPSESSENILARLGGDEFTVLLGEIRTPGDVLAIAMRIRKELVLPFTVAGRDVRISASVGVSISTSGESGAEDILHAADKAMYHSKATGSVVVAGSPEQLNERIWIDHGGSPDSDEIACIRC